ncbi:MAG: glutathione-regulated potassium-efflux system protein KefB [Nevskiaceae bacterium]|nr:MAG: glutathione-regulated potassium-efflux system protein KefB [Nevskiaceae bacterium]TAM32146.1 MAG: glutathione-regulated potassium-efflux system protein KefB [Nevskiaceae bacterium]
MLQEAALFLAAAVLFVPLFKRARLGSVLGYLAAGLAIGPHGLGYARDAEQVLHVSEFGVVLLLFVIGLELQPRRLWTLRREVFGLGGAQVLFTALPLAGLAHYFGVAWSGAAVIGLALAMSSTALVLQLLGERGELAARHGRGAFAILLFQDIAVIPLLALIPLLSAPASAGIGWQEIAKALAVVAAVIASGRTLLRPALRALANAQVPEIFTAAALLLVIGVSLAMQAVGLSASLGAFLAGVLLADSEYRHELQADLEPFKGLLLGLFFIAVGMGADLGLIASAPLTVLGLALGLLLLKSLVLYALGRGAGMNHHSALRLGGALAQGGEFAFVLFAVAAAAGLLDAPERELLTVAVTLSMIATPPLYALLAMLARRQQPEPAPYDEIQVAETPVVIAGFGPFGQIIGRVLRVKKIPYTVLDKNAEHVQFVRSFGNPVFFSDAARHEVLRAAHVHQARLFVIAIADEAESLRVAQAVRAFAPKLRVMASARTRQHALQLIDTGINPDDVIRRAYFSSLEMTRRVLLALDLPPREVHRAVDLFHQQDQQTLMRQHAVYQDEAALRAAANQFTRELEQLFEADNESERAAAKAQAAAARSQPTEETP